MSSLHKKQTFIVPVLLLIAGMLLPACQVPEDASPEPKPTPTSTVQEDVPQAVVPIAMVDSQGNVTRGDPSDLNRETSPQVDESVLAELVQGNNAFAFDLYQAIRAENDNLFYSPYSLSIALAMTHAGARADTELQMQDVLHFTLPQEQLHPAFNALDLNLSGMPGERSSSEDFQLNIANSIWGQEGHPFVPDYLGVIERNYGAGMRLVDFIDETQREETRKIINEWVSSETQGKIQDLFPEGIFNDMTRLVLANAIYFQADWEEPFLNGTRDDDFYLLDGSTVTVPMMSRRHDTRYFEGQGYQAVDILYKGGQMRMAVVLPDEGQFESFEDSLSHQVYDDILSGFESHDVKLYLPKFDYEARLTLAETLSGMGMQDAFDSRLADFSGISEDPTLFLAHVVHKAFVAVDELGTEAAAASGVVAEVESMPITMTVNRPFLFFIYDSESGTILFIGRVLDPS